MMTELATAELSCEGAVLLPAREALALFNVNVAVPVNTALALNVLTEASTAMAEATQGLGVVQS